MRAFDGTTGQLQARSAATGALLWSRPGGTSWGSPTVTGGVVYSPGTENGAARLFARRADTGALRWRFGTAAYGAPVISGGRVYATASTLVGGEPVTLVEQFALGAA